MHPIRRALVLGGTAAILSATPAAAADQVIVKFRDGAAAGAVERLLAGTTQVGTVRHAGARVITTPGRGEALIGALRRSGLVEYAERDGVMRIAATPNDPSVPTMYGLGKIKASEGWDGFGLSATWPGTGGVKVGIVDTGVRASHVDIGASRIVNCAATAPGVLGGLFGANPVPSESRGCADDNGHGTHVAGTIAGTANNGTGVAGVAFNSPLAICKALHGAAGSGSTSGVANCITYLADRGAQVISMSLGGGANSALQSAVNYAVGKGAVIVAAAGNDGNATLNYPAAYPNVVSVAATDANDAKASFSNANADVEIAAPGVNILSTWNTGDTAYNTISGTSMATPHVAGAAALIRARAGSAAATVAKLDASVDDLGAPGRDSSYGFGRLNLQKAAG
jgi:thermitase